MIYDTLAYYYDLLAADEAASDRWVEWVESYHPQKKFLELACGTGEITKRLAKHHDVSALDLSGQMVAIAARKDTDMVIDFSCGDMRDLSEYGLYDAIGCFCDSFNYLLTEEDVEIFFQQVADHLNQGGLFFFDTHSLDRLEEFEEEYTETGTFEDGTQVQWVIASEDDFIFQDFAFYFDKQTQCEHHLQKVYDPGLLENMLLKHFEIVDISTDWDTRGIAPGEKYFFVCRKKEAG